MRGLPQSMVDSLSFADPLQALLTTIPAIVYAIPLIGLQSIKLVLFRLYSGNSGNIDDVLLFDTVIDQTQIYEIYHNATSNDLS